MNKYRLIALDLDGTLLTDDKRITLESQRWIKIAERMGITISFATGRGRPTSFQYWNVLRPSSPMVLINGAETWRNFEEVLHREFLEPDTIPRLHSLALKYDVDYWAHAIGSIIRREEWAKRYPENSKWLKFLMCHGDASVIAELRQVVVAMGDLEVTWSSPMMLEVSRLGVTKATGLAEIARYLGLVASEVVVIGDNMNDLDMIKWAGLGIAMGNAENIIKDAADYITATNEEDGVAKAIQLVLNGRL